MYCHATGVPLTREHLIPEAIGGKWSLPDSVCDPCRTLVNQPETRILKADLHTIRVALEVRRKRQGAKERKNGPLLPRKIATEPTQFGSAGDERFAYQPSLDEKPPILVLLRFLEPSRLPGHERDESQHALRLNFFNLFGDRAQKHEEVEFREPVNPWEFAFSLAKWGYGFAVAERGIDCCDTTDIRRLMIGETGDPMSFAGDTTVASFPRIRSLHWLSLREQDGVLVATVHLFASAGFAAYDVVVGPIRTAPKARN